MNRDTLTQILELARWAPSGDNTQPWRFEVVDDQSIRVHGFDTRDQILYDLDGHPSHIAHGALLETIRIAATGFGLLATWTINSNDDDRKPVYDVHLVPDPAITRDPLFEFIESRTVHRRPMRTTSLTATQRRALINAAGNGHAVQLFESTTERIKVAQLLWDSAEIRLTCPEAYPVHRDIIEWRARFSKDKIPEQAVGVDPVTARIMEWAMQSWGRVHFLNRFLLGTVVPRIQLDFLPGVFCAAHLLLRPVGGLHQLSDWIRLGMTVQRIWLTATMHGLCMQPQMTPVIFRWYVQAMRRFTTVSTIGEKAHAMARRFERLANAESPDMFGFFARVGTSTPPNSRSTRQDLDRLMTRPSKGGRN